MIDLAYQKCCSPISKFRQARDQFGLPAHPVPRSLFQSSNLAVFQAFIYIKPVPSPRLARSETSLVYELSLCQTDCDLFVMYNPEIKSPAKILRNAKRMACFMKINSSSNNLEQVENKPSSPLLTFSSVVLTDLPLNCTQKVPFETQQELLTKMEHLQRGLIQAEKAFR